MQDDAPSTAVALHRRVEAVSSETEMVRCAVRLLHFVRNDSKCRYPHAYARGPENNEHAPVKKIRMGIKHTQGPPLEAEGLGMNQEKPKSYFTFLTRPAVLPFKFLSGIFFK